MSHRAERQSFVYYLDKALEASTGAQQMDAFKACVEQLVHGITGPGHDQVLRTLLAQLQASQSMPRRLRALEFCSSVVFDKAPLPSAPGEPAHFLWLFAVPFQVTLAPHALADAATRRPLVDADALLAVLEGSGYVGYGHPLRASSRLFRREDLQCHGPRGLAELFVHAELHGEDLMHTLPLPFEAELEAYRTVTLFVLGACRCPVGTTSIFNRALSWPATELEAIVTAGMRSDSLSIQQLDSLPPHSLAEMMLRCAGPGALELLANLAHAKQAYGGIEVAARIYGDTGYADIIGRTGTESILLVPPFSYFEARSELDALLARGCAALGLTYNGAVIQRVGLSASQH